MRPALSAIEGFPLWKRGQGDFKIIFPLNTLGFATGT